MKKSRIIMGLTVSVEIVGEGATEEIFKKVFDYFEAVDRRFSTYKEESEISRLNRGEILKNAWSGEMKEVFHLAEETKEETDGFFDIEYEKGKYDPSGLVKGLAIKRAADIIRKAGYADFFVDAGGDIEVEGRNEKGLPWKVGIRNPWKPGEIVKIIYLKKGGIATSGNYVRGPHIYNPKNSGKASEGVSSVTVIAGDIFDADRFATAAFAMGKEGILFLERKKGVEGYMIDSEGVGTETSGFASFLQAS